MTIEEKLYRKMYLVRKTELEIEKLFENGFLRGTTHGSRGQEACEVPFLEHVDPKSDYITGTHRSHGHLLSLTFDPYELIAELMGKRTGVVGGKGGSQHLHYMNFYTNGITGGMAPIAVGMAYALKLKTDSSIAISFFGDGAMNEGYLMESLNLASAYDLPIIFALENNHYAMSTRTSDITGGNFEKRAIGFGLRYIRIKADDAIKVYNETGKVIEFVRNDRQPYFIEFDTFRFSGHSKSDKREYIPKAEDDFWKMNDPLLKLEKAIGENCKMIKKEIDDLIDLAIEKAKKDELPDPIKYYRE